MTHRKLISSFLVILVISLLAGAYPAAADSSHARIIRLSLVQGDVRFAREIHGDPLADSNATWENAGLNLPIRQGYVLATDKGRAEVEFENGTIAFLKENTVLEFYDLSLNDDMRMTRLILRQGSASFHVNPAGGEYFSVTGGDFTVQSDHGSTFRVDNYDDGSMVETYRGRVSVLQHKNSTQLKKGQSLSMKAGDDSSLTVGNLQQEDDFDQWVSGQIESVSAATVASQQYTGSSSYVPGFADLYTYGAFSNCGAYGYGWRPFGVGLGWSPFTSGQWIFDPASGGYAWLSYQPWGWAPYHYGGWLFDASCGGWFYSPPIPYGYAGYPVGPVRRFPKGVHPPRPIYHPATAVFVRSGGKTGIVPMHPLDAKGKTPLNLERGVFSVAGNKGVSTQPVPVERGQKWETLKSPPREVLSNTMVASGAPARVSRTVEEGKSGVRVVSLGKDSSIVYDSREHRFVNTNSPAFSSSANEKQLHAENGRTGASSVSTPLAGLPPRSPAAPPVMRGANSTPPARVTVPPPAPRYSGGTYSAGGRGGTSWGGTSSPSGAGSSGRSPSSPSTPAPAAHPSSGRPH
ncbi:MAG TPA: FecR family protein [Candidatus Acidoferrum sp.]|nr:FecR family protein [Candidatus Acidoferrum sp.]